MAGRPETVEALAAAGVPFATAEAITRYLMEAKLIRRSTRGRPGLKAFNYDPNEYAVIWIGLAAHLAAHAPLAVNDLEDHVPEPTGALWQSAPRGSFEDLLAPLVAETTLRTWLSATFVRFAALTSEERQAWRMDEVAKIAFLEFVTSSDISTGVGSSSARFEWGPAGNRRSQEFRPPVPQSWNEILEIDEPSYRPAIKLYFPLLLVPGNLLAASNEHSRDQTVAPLPGEATDSKTSPRKRTGMGSNPPILTRR